MNQVNKSTTNRDRLTRFQTILSTITSDPTVPTSTTTMTKLPTTQTGNNSNNNEHDKLVL